MNITPNKLTPNYLSAKSRFQIHAQNPTDIPLAWEALCRARFSDERGIQSVRLLSISKTEECRGPSWQRASWNQTKTQRALLLVFEVKDFLPASQMREILLGTQRLFAAESERPVYFTVVASPNSSRCVQRLYPLPRKWEDALKSAQFLFRKKASSTSGFKQGSDWQNALSISKAA